MRRGDISRDLARAWQFCFEGAAVSPTADELRAIAELAGRGGRIPIYERAFVQCGPVVGEEAGEVDGGRPVVEAATRLRIARHALEDAGAGIGGLRAQVQTLAPHATVEEVDRLVGLIGEARPLPRNKYEVVDNLPPGVLAQVTYTKAQMADRPNHNRRIYVYKDMKKAAKEGDALAKEGAMFALGGHPAMCEIATMNKVAGLVREVRFVNPSGFIEIDLDVIEGVQGRAALSILRASGALPISSRAWCDVEVVTFYEGEYGAFGDKELDLLKADEDQLYYVCREITFEGWDFVAGFQGVEGARVGPKTKGVALKREGFNDSNHRAPTGARREGAMPDMEKLYERLQAAHEALRAENDKAVREGADADARRRIAEHEKATADAAARAATDKVKALETQVADLSQKLLDAQGKAAESRYKADAHDALAARVNDLADAKVRADRATADLAAATTKLGTAEADLARIAGEKVAIEARLAALTAERDALAGKLAAAEAKLNPPAEAPELAAARAELESLKAQAAAERARVARVEFNAAIEKRLKSGKYGHFADLLAPTCQVGADEAVPPIAEAETRVGQAEGFVHALLERHRSNDVFEPPVRPMAPQAPAQAPPMGVAENRGARVSGLGDPPKPTGSVLPMLDEVM